MIEIGDWRFGIWHWAFGIWGGSSGSLHNWILIGLEDFGLLGSRFLDCCIVIYL